MTDDFELPSILIVLGLVLEEAGVVDWAKYSYKNDYGRVTMFLEARSKEDDPIASSYVIRNGRQIFLDAEDDVHARRLEEDLREVASYMQRGIFPDVELIPVVQEHYSKFRRD